MKGNITNKLGRILATGIIGSGVITGLTGCATALGNYGASAFFANAAASQPNQSRANALIAGSNFTRDLGFHQTLTNGNQNFNNIPYPNSNGNFIIAWPEYIVKNGERGITIHTYGTASNMQGGNIKIVAYFYEGNLELQDVDGRYRTNNGQVSASSGSLAMPFAVTNFSDLEVFIPNSQIEGNKGNDLSVELDLFDNSGPSPKFLSRYPRIDVKLIED